MFHNPTYRKFLLIGGSLVVLLALGVVLGLAIVRIQNPKSTVTQPKAVGPAVTWPGCATTGSSYNCENKSGSCYVSGGPDNENIVKCCAKLGAGGSIYDCAWPARGFCTPTQCNAAEKDLSAGCSTNPDGTKNCNTKGGQCGLYTYNQGSGCYGIGNFNGTCSWQADCVQGQDCVNGTCKTTNNPCWVYVPIPANGAPQDSGVSAAPTFAWNYDTSFSSTVNGACVYLFSCPARNDSCLIGSACGNGNSFTSLDFSKFNKPNLTANTTYYWGVNVNSYSPPPGTTQYDCMPKWSFTTGAGTSCSSGQTPCGSSCVNTQTDNNNCGACGKVCSTGQNCSNGVCVVGSTTANECEVCGGGNTKSCGAGLKCSGTSSTVGVCIKNDGTSSCGACTTDNDCLLKALVCVNGSCVDPASAHLGCGAHSTCVRKSGGGADADSCTTVGGSCGTSGSSQVNACWGNGGTDGKCYDCNGDGEINILDFACFRANYLKNVQ